jgi:ABC-type transporter Mla subunit MlaD
MKTSNKKLFLMSITQLIAGIQKHFASASVIVANQTYTGPQLVAVLQPLADLVSATTASRAAWQSDSAAETKAIAQANEFLSSLQQAVYAAYGNAVATLADFGLPPHKRTAPTAAVKAAAALKAKATRIARGEVGTKKRATIEAPATTAGTSPTPPAPLAPAK